MTHWLRFERAGGVAGFGTLDGSTIHVHEGDMFAGAQPTGETLALDAVRLDVPTACSKMICLWNNFHQLGRKLGVEPPAHPLWFIKASSSYAAHGDTVRKPAHYDGKVIYEGELGIVIGRRAQALSPEDAQAAIFGYTCVNDITAIGYLKEDANFDQWSRAKSFDGFGAFGPLVATDVDPATLVVRTVLNGEERQNYPISDMVFPAAELISRLSHDVTLEPGDVIACGTNVGVGTMKEPENTVEIHIDGVGTLINTFVN